MAKVVRWPWAVDRPRARVREDPPGFTLRYRSKHRVELGRAHQGKRVLVLVADLDIGVIDQDRGTIRHLEPDPTVDYQRHLSSS